MIKTSLEYFQKSYQGNGDACAIIGTEAGCGK
jgi:hypothetical protein